MIFNMLYSIEIILQIMVKVSIYAIKLKTTKNFNEMILCLPSGIS